MDKLEIIVPELNSELKNQLATAESPYDVLAGVRQLIKVKKDLEAQKKEFDAIVAEKLEAYNNAMGEIADRESEFKAVGLKYLENDPSAWKTTRKIDNETGEVTVKKTHQLPKGMKFNKGRTSYDYDEEKITDDKFYKKTLKKTDIKKAVENGELPTDVLIKKVGTSSITIDTVAFTAKALEFDIK